MDDEGALGRAIDPLCDRGRRVGLQGDESLLGSVGLRVERFGLPSEFLASASPDVPIAIPVYNFIELP